MLFIIIFFINFIIFIILLKLWYNTYFYFNFYRDNIIQKDLQEDSAEESEGELSRSKKQESPPIIEINDVDETKVQLVDHNWSFLSTILPDREEIEHWFSINFVLILFIHVILNNI